MLLKVLVVFTVVQVWEILCMPGVSHVPGNRGIGVSLAGIFAGAVWLRPHFSHPSTSFVYGFACSLLFVWRFLNMDRFALWVQYQAPRDSIIMLVWYLFATLLGLLSAGLWILLPYPRRDHAERSNKKAPAVNGRG